MSRVSKFRIKGKIYYFIERLPNKDESFINEMWAIENSKKEKFTLVMTNKYKVFTLYDSNDKKVMSVKHITEIV